MNVIIKSMIIIFSLSPEVYLGTRVKLCKFIVFVNLLEYFEVGEIGMLKSNIMV